MKKLLTITCLLLATISVNAQKYTWLIDASGFYDHQKDNYASLNNWQADLIVGKQVGKHWAFGLSWSKGEKQYLKSDTASYNSAFGPTVYTIYLPYHRSIDKLGLWARYVYNINKRFFFYVQLNGGFVFRSNESQFGTRLGPSTPLTNAGINTETPYYRDNGFVNLTPAIAMTIYKGYGVHASIGGIQYEHSGVYGFDNYDRVTIDFAKQLSIGIQKIINTKKSRKLMQDKK